MAVAWGPGDLDLNAELGGIYPTYDACVLEFDRVPIGKPVPMACVRNGQLELTFFDGSQGANAMIFDAMGRAVRNFPIAGSAMNVEIASFFPGGYALRVETLEGPVVRRFAKD